MALLNRQISVVIIVSILPILFYWLYTSTTMHPLIVGAFSTWLSATATQAYCPPPGPLLPPPRILSNSTKFAVSDTAFANVPWAADTSFAIKASIDDVTVFEYEHSAPGRDVGQSLLETSLRIGSVTKTFTMLAILLSADKIKLSDSITKFIPELQEHAYKDITIAALASHTSGLGRYIYVGDLAIVPDFNPAMLGLPGINATGSKVSTCDPFPGARICTREEVVAGLNNPAYYPRSTNSGPLYSNIGFTLLGMALEAVHKKTSEQIIHDLITFPLSLSKTSFSTPKNVSTALLPRSKADGRWFVPSFGNYNPSGGLWSTPNDQLKFLQSILSHKLLSKPATQRWLQPRALLPSLHQAVGESWEILRPTDLDVKTSRAIDIFTKTGGVTGYAAYAAIVPEYDIALTINAAGGQAQDAVSTLFPQLVRPLVAYADKLAQQQARAEYAGTYTALGVANSMTLAVDDGPGLAIEDLTMNGVPVLQSLAALQKIPYESLSARLYLTDPSSLGMEEEAWRISIDRKDQEKKFADLECASWNWGDAFRYVTEPLDTVIFTKDAGETVGVELLGWRLKLHRT
ncbi:beta-lactamase/transpeptidase-like protein [Didymella exigua CBS 183.55]|uniref:Beta-lactamase/transpeptidase-like protein n=1 Tax=Didymella exigua CBS 183.55 TaxID=1150837 RepID=A0A6A5R9D6_9PLEO|nr:beta-lactamase/transpeptidase-like protein [Didymella exigua CBS 183.55]KAF1924845.1 beta-lactamase/transpeptidase-like protein [Didymella exigua CBS 183.55]